MVVHHLKVQSVNKVLQILQVIQVINCLSVQYFRDCLQIHIKTTIDDCLKFAQSATRVEISSNEVQEITELF